MAASLTLTQNLKAVILVGGPSRGTRFRPLSLSKPKPLFPIAGRPMVYHHVAAFAAVPGMKEILIVGFFEPAVFQQFLQDAQAEFPQVTIRYLREYQMLGTGGGLYHFRDQVTRGKTDLFFVVHVDVCSAMPLQAMLDSHRKHPNGACTLLGTKVPKDIATRFGCLVANSESQEVTHYVEKPETFVSDTISCGLYLFHPNIFQDMAEAVRNHHVRQQEDEASGDAFAMSSSPDVVRLEQDVLRPMAGTGRLFVYETHEFWRQIKTAGSALPANRLYLMKYRLKAPKLLAPETLSFISANGADKGGPTIVGDVFIDPTAQVHPSAKLGPNVSIGKRVILGKGVRVKDSIILDNAEIKANSCILHSIIGWDGKIGSWARIEGTPPNATSDNISPAANISDLGGTVWTQPMTDLMLPNGQKNQSATILGEDVKVADEMIIRNCIVLPHKELKASFKNEILM